MEILKGLQSHDHKKKEKALNKLDKLDAEEIENQLKAIGLYEKTLGSADSDLLKAIQLSLENRNQPITIRGTFLYLIKYLLFIIH